MHGVSLTLLFPSAMQVMNRHSRDLMSWKSEVNKMKKKARELHSLRCDMGYKLNVSSPVVLCYMLFLCLSHRIALVSHK